MTPADRIVAIRERLAVAVAAAMKSGWETPEEQEFFKNAPADLEWLLKRVERLEGALRNSKREHRREDDKDNECNYWYLLGTCDCGANEHNAKADAALNGDG